jgi:hypothetical protein
MTIRLSPLPRDPYLGFDARCVACMAAACMHCSHPASCSLACSRKADIPRTILPASRVAREGLSLTRWLWDQDKVDAARVTDASKDAYN